MNDYFFLFPCPKKKYFSNNDKNISTGCHLSTYFKKTIKIKNHHARLRMCESQLNILARWDISNIRWNVSGKEPIENQKDGWTNLLCLLYL